MSFHENSIVSEKQKEKLRGGGGGSEGSILSSIFEKFVLAMVVYFVVSIVNSLAQSYAKRLENEKKAKHHDWKFNIIALLQS